MSYSIDQITEFFSGTFGIVEANNFERMCLWEKYHEEMKWKECLSGLLPTVGFIDSRPVVISLFYSTLNEKKIVFWYATSKVVDYEMINNWFENNLPESAFHNSVDASNFHNVFIPR